ncbi:MAG: PDGLE domain-containing protein [Pirellulales bacterium]
MAGGLQDAAFIAELFRVHALIGIGEAGLAILAQTLVIATLAKSAGLRTWIVAAVACVAVCVAPLASGLPDGLEFTGERFGLNGANIATALNAWQWSDYQVPRLGESAISTIVAGIVGATIVSLFGVLTTRVRSQA